MQRWLRLSFTALCAATLAACGGGGASIGPSPAVVAAPTNAPGSVGATPTPVPGTKGATPTPAPTVTPTMAPSGAPTPTAPPATTLSGPTAPPDAPGHTNVIPSPPPVGQSRPGQIYNVYIQAPTGDTVAMTVFEPATVVGGKTYPLVLHGHGFGGSRDTSLTSSSPSKTSTVTGSANTGGNIPPLVAANYGVISFDQRGHGESGGKIRVMDPDFEGKDYLAIMDWAQAKLSWLAYGPTLDGNDAHEPIMGAIGGSYGGMYQYMLLNIDKRHRLRAMVPQIAPSNLNFSLFQNGVIKSEWDSVLFGLGTGAGSGTNRNNFDPYVNNTLTNDLAANAEDTYAIDFFGYHSADYFCNGTSFATNGGAGTCQAV